MHKSWNLNWTTPTRSATGPATLMSALFVRFRLTRPISLSKSPHFTKRISVCPPLAETHFSTITVGRHSRGNTERGRSLIFEGCPSLVGIECPVTRWTDLVTHLRFFIWGSECFTERSLSHSWMSQCAPIYFILALSSGFLCLRGITEVRYE